MYAHNHIMVTYMSKLVTVFNSPTYAHTLTYIHTHTHVVNAADNKQRDPNMTTMKIVIDP